MEEADYIWMDGKYVAWKDAKVHVLSHALHYGSGAFEGIRCYSTPKGPAIFRLKEHIDRLWHSASVFGMEIPYTKKEFMQATIGLIKKNRLDACYIRPIIFFGYKNLGVNPTGNPINCVIATWPWGAYLGKDVVRVKVASTIRLHPKSTDTSAKICGHYVNSIQANREAKKAGYDEALMLDEDGYVTEGSGENLFMVKDGILLTPPLGNILPGITRDSVMQLARDMDTPVEEKRITLDDVKAADEVFFTGTAAEIVAIGEIDDTTIIGTPGPITKKLRKQFLGIVHGTSDAHKEWLTFVK